MDSPDGGGTPVPPPWKAYTHERQRALERELQWLAEPRQQQMLQQLQQKEEEPMDEVGYFWWDAVGCFEEAARRQEEEDLDGDARTRRSDWHVSCYSSVAPVIGYDASSITSPDIEDHDNCCWDEVGCLTGGSAAEADEVDREGLAAELEAAH